MNFLNDVSLNQDVNSIKILINNCWLQFLVSHKRNLLPFWVLILLIGREYLLLETPSKYVYMCINMWVKIKIEGLKKLKLYQIFLEENFFNYMKDWRTLPPKNFHKSQIFFNFLHYFYHASTLSYPCFVINKMLFACCSI